MSFCSFMIYLHCWLVFMIAMIQNVLETVLITKIGIWQNLNSLMAHWCFNNYFCPISTVCKFFSILTFWKWTWRSFGRWVAEQMKSDVTDWQSWLIDYGFPFVYKNVLIVLYFGRCLMTDSPVLSLGQNCMISIIDSASLMFRVICLKFFVHLLSHVILNLASYPAFCLGL